MKYSSVKSWGAAHARPAPDAVARHSTRIRLRRQVLDFQEDCVFPSNDQRPMFLKHGTGRHRSLGAVDPVRVGILQEAGAILIEEIRENEISQALCVLRPVKSAGVMGNSGPTRMSSGLAIRDSCSTQHSPTHSRPCKSSRGFWNGPPVQKSHTGCLRRTPTLWRPTRARNPRQSVPNPMQQRRRSARA